MKNTIVVWLYDWGFNSELDSLKSNPYKISVCIDKEPKVEAILRLTLNKLELNPFKVSNIHCWSVEDEELKKYYFLNDEQNNFVKQELITSCSIVP